MEDYKIDIMLDSGPNARTVQITLNPFTLVGATTRSGLLTSPLRARFGINARLEYYDAELLTSIVKRSAEILETPHRGRLPLMKSLVAAVAPPALPTTCYAVPATLPRSRETEWSIRPLPRWP